jgi:hypothetical protein
VNSNCSAQRSTEHEDVRSVNHIRPREGILHDGMSVLLYSLLGWKTLRVRIASICNQEEIALEVLVHLLDEVQPCSDVLVLRKTLLPAFSWKKTNVGALFDSSWRTNQPCNLMPSSAVMFTSSKGSSLNDYSQLAFQKDTYGPWDCRP